MRTDMQWTPHIYMYISWENVGRDYITQWWASLTVHVIFWTHQDKEVTWPLLLHNSPTVLVSSPNKCCVYLIAGNIGGLARNQVKINLAIRYVIVTGIVKISVDILIWQYIRTETAKFSSYMVDIGMWPKHSYKKPVSTPKIMVCIYTVYIAIYCTNLYRQGMNGTFHFSLQSVHYHSMTLKVYNDIIIYACNNAKGIYENLANIKFSDDLYQSHTHNAIVGDFSQTRQFAKLKTSPKFLYGMLSCQHNCFYTTLLQNCLHTQLEWNLLARLSLP